MVKSLGFNFIKPLLNGLILGEMDDHSVSKLESKPLNITMNKYKPSSCPECGKTFVNNHGVKVHISKVHELKCDGCQNTFQSAKNLQYHSEICSLPSEPVIETECEMCYRTFKNKVDVKNCMQKHNDWQSSIRKTPKPDAKDSLKRKEIGDGENCYFKTDNVSELDNHKKNEHLELRSPDPKKSKDDIIVPVEDTLERMKSLTVRGDENMDFESEKQEATVVKEVPDQNKIEDNSSSLNDKKEINKKRKWESNTNVKTSNTVNMVNKEGNAEGSKKRDPNL